MEQLHRHTGEVEAVLRGACKVARVNIVTQGTEPWVKQTMEYMSAGGIDMEALLEELGIAVYYANLKEIVQSSAAMRATTAAELCIAAKKIVMTTILREHFGDSPKVQWHAVSIGDSTVELM